MEKQRETKIGWVRLYESKHSKNLSQVYASYEAAIEYIPTDWIPISLPVEVTFTMYTSEELLGKHIQQLDNEIDNIRQVALNKIEELNHKKQDLLAITFKEQSCPSSY